MRPYVPPWTVYAFFAGGSFYWLAGAVQRGIDGFFLVLSAVFALLALDMWRRDLRNRPPDR